MTELIELLSSLLGVSISGLSAALLTYIPIVEMIKKMLPKEFTLFGKLVNTGLVLAFVVGLLAGGYAQYTVVSVDGLIPLEYVSIVWAGILAFLMGAGWYSAFKTPGKTELSYTEVTDSGEVTTGAAVVEGQT